MKPVSISKSGVPCRNSASRAKTQPTSTKPTNPRYSPLSPNVAQPDGSGRWRVDLVAANRQQLEVAGLAPAHIVESAITTANPSLFSDRAARPCGRFGLLARLAAR